MLRPPDFPDQRSARLRSSAVRARPGMSAAREFPLWIVGGLIAALAITIAILIRSLLAARAQAAAPRAAIPPSPSESEAIAALKVSESRLRESEARFRQLAESIASVSYLIAR